MIARRAIIDRARAATDNYVNRRRPASHIVHCKRLGFGLFLSGPTGACDG